MHRLVDLSTEADKSHVANRNMVVGDGTLPLEAVVSANEKLAKLRKEAEALEAAAALENPSSSSDDDTGVKLAQVYDKLHELKSNAAEARASKILAGLGFTEHMLASPTSEISGGWRMRISLLTMEETPVEYLLRLHPDQKGCSKQEAVRAQLGKFGLPSHNHVTPIGNLYGGQKATVVLASISMTKPHILVLDESTNHLDMQPIYALADALYSFKGGVVLVSYDSRLISRVCEDEEEKEI
ncbi:unnamed protein product [Microthlaspi erraticum]|uniref:Uncharacterized protein n=1 Tax=Microthlaspi erraticum TaxID=1685480 RepID=A0A6D2IS34_9BRAS|nr:unnamed protein product [Microthlaspi erraticum]